MLEKPAFIQGLFEFEGRGLATPVSFPIPAIYKVPSDKRAQTVYFRAGNAAGEMIYLVLTRSGQAMRYFPVGAKGSIHIALAVLEDLSPGSTMEVLIAAPQGTKSALVLDVGFMEIA
ncbi:MAG TPA: hypothetical protein VGG72_14350 [Bryobacteraceae bacterium]